MRDNRKTVNLANGINLKLPPWCIHEYERSVALDLPTGRKLFAKWYVIIK